MSQCSPTSDCFKASFQFKMDKALGKTTDNTTKAEWQALGGAPATGTTPSPKSPNLGTNFDSEG